jgi:hypothetical protein
MLRAEVVMRLVCLILAVVTSALASVDQRTHKLDLYTGGGIFTQVVDSAEWKTTFVFHNMDVTPINVVIFFRDDKGLPLILPIGGRLSMTYVFTLPVNYTMVIETDGTGSLKQGYAVVYTCDKMCADATSKPIDAKLASAAIFRQHVEGRQDSEAVVPIEMPEKDAHVVFDNRGGYQTGIALLNFMGGAVTVTIRDQAGATLATDTLNVAEDEKTVFVLASKYPVTAGKYGSVEIQGDGVAVMGLRFNPSGSFTSCHAMTMH